MELCFGFAGTVIAVNAIAAIPVDRRLGNFSGVPLIVATRARRLAGKPIAAVNGNIAIGIRQHA